MSLFVTGDLHGRSYLRKLDAFAAEFGSALSRDDVLVILGDFSVPWSCPPDDTDRALIDHIDAYPFTTTFIDGNHENYDAIDALPVARDALFGGTTTRRLAPHVHRLLSARAYRIADHDILVMGGAKSIDADALAKAGSWWPREVPSEATKASLKRIVSRKKRFDIVFTHTPPTRQLKVHADAVMETWQPDDYTDWLDANIAAKVRFGQWFYGHMHDDRPWETPYTPLMHVIYDVDGAFPDRLWGPDSYLDDWYPGDPF